MAAERLRIEPRKRPKRGAAANPRPRFERLSYVGAADEAPEERDRSLSTTVTDEAARTIITRNASPDIGFDRSINPYRGCEHGCVYCFARPSHAHLGLSPGLEFETTLFAKPDAAELLRKELGRRTYVCGPIALGTNTDPYQPIERSRAITRSVLEVLEQTRHPVGIVTKSDLVLRDLDILARMASHRLAKVGISVTTLDPKLARLMEPRAPGPMKRLDAVKRLSEAGVPVTVLAAPVIPAINDHEIEAIVEAAAQRGASRVNYVLLRLPHEVKDLMCDWLGRHFPDRGERVMSIVRQTRRGREYDSRWGVRQRGEGVFADLIAQRFQLAARRHRLASGSISLRTDLFSPPAVGAAQRQPDLFAGSAA